MDKLLKSATKEVHTLSLQPGHDSSFHLIIWSNRCPQRYSFSLGSLSLDYVVDEIKWWYPILQLILGWLVMYDYSIIYLLCFQSPLNCCLEVLSIALPIVTGSRTPVWIITIRFISHLYFIQHNPVYIMFLWNTICTQRSITMSFPTKLGFCTFSLIKPCNDFSSTDSSFLPYSDEAMFYQLSRYSEEMPYFLSWAMPIAGNFQLLKLLTLPSCARNPSCNLPILKINNVIYTFLWNTKSDCNFLLNALPIVLNQFTFFFGLAMVSTHTNHSKYHK